MSGSRLAQAWIRPGLVSTCHWGKVTCRGPEVPHMKWEEHNGGLPKWWYLYPQIDPNRWFTKENPHLKWMSDDGWGCFPKGNPHIGITMQAIACPGPTNQGQVADSGQLSYCARRQWGNDQQSNPSTPQQPIRSFVARSRSRFGQSLSQNRITAGTGGKALGWTDPRICPGGLRGWAWDGHLWFETTEGSSRNGMDRWILECWW